MDRRRLLNVRASGLLLHLTSLPGPHGCGDLGPWAYRFADFLQASGQRWWQVLPLGPLGKGSSPYQTLSAFAGNPLLISLELLAQDGWLDPDDLSPFGELSAGRVNYPAVERFKAQRLRRAFARFERRRDRQQARHFDAFCEQQGWWLTDVALFCALRHARHGAPWASWELPLRQRQPHALTRESQRLGPELRYHQFLQFVFFDQWERLRRYCAKRHIGFIGDVPFYVAQESADVWSHPELFWLDRHGQPTIVAGVPPDYFSRTGQLWGNPLYRWDRLRAQGYAWWVARLRAAFAQVDVVRLDHFIGFHRSWALPPDATTARHGRFMPGPGRAFFDAVRRALGDVNIIAEDLGTVTPEVVTLRDRYGFPGMRVLQFAFGEDPSLAHHQPHAFIRRCVVYTGTHDNDTTVGWFTGEASTTSTRSPAAVRKERAFALQYLGREGRQIHWGLIRLALMSVADLAVIPVQDLLGLGSEARMNHPGIEDGNWRWRLAEDALTPDLAQRLRLLTHTYGRIPRDRTPGTWRHAPLAGSRWRRLSRRRAWRRRRMPMVSRLLSAVGHSRGRR